MRFVEETHITHEFRIGVFYLLQFVRCVIRPSFLIVRFQIVLSQQIEATAFGQQFDSSELENEKIVGIPRLHDQTRCTP